MDLIYCKGTPPLILVSKEKYTHPKDQRKVFQLPTIPKDFQCNQIIANHIAPLTLPAIKYSILRIQKQVALTCYFENDTLWAENEPPV